MLARGVSSVPIGAPAGRAEVKDPTAYTVSPMIVWSQITPSIWTVGSASALTVESVVGGSGAVSAVAGEAVRDNNGRNSTATEATLSRRNRLRRARIGGPEGSTIDSDESDTTRS